MMFRIKWFFRWFPWWALGLLIMLEGWVAMAFMATFQYVDRGIAFHIYDVAMSDSARWRRAVIERLKADHA